MSLWSQLADKHGYTGSSSGLCLGIPTINRKDLLKDLLNNLADTLPKIDTDFIRIVIIDNGNQNIKSIVPGSIADKTTIFIEKENLGVAPSWNKIMDHCFTEYNCGGVSLINDDIVLGSKCLERLGNILQEFNGKFFINSPYYWSNFTITRQCWEIIGHFDPNYFPAYFEDNDYHRRLHLYEAHIGRTLCVIDDELKPAVCRNSSSISKNGQLNKGYHHNAIYFRDKWGGNPRNAVYKTPFNKGGDTP